MFDSYYIDFNKHMDEQHASKFPDADVEKFNGDHGSKFRDADEENSNDGNSSDEQTKEEEGDTDESDSESGEGDSDDGTFTYDDVRALLRYNRHRYN